MGQKFNPHSRVGEIVSYLKTLNEDEQIKSLVKFALENNLEKAFEAGRILGNAYVLRGFHGELTSLHYQQLIETKRIVSL